MNAKTPCFPLASVRVLFRYERTFGSLSPEIKNASHRIDFNDYFQKHPGSLDSVVLRHEECCPSQAIRRQRRISPKIRLPSGVATSNNNATETRGIIGKEAIFRLPQRMGVYVRLTEYSKAPVPATFAPVEIVAWNFLPILMDGRR